MIDWPDPVRFLLFRTDKKLPLSKMSTYYLQTLIDVKLAITDPGGLPQLLGQLVVAADMNDGETWGVLTNLMSWRFFRVCGSASCTLLLRVFPPSCCAYLL